MAELKEKLLRVQMALKAPKSQYNEYGKYNYRNAEDILEAVKPLLMEEGLLLTISDEMIYVGERYYIKAIARLTDGEETIEAAAFAREDESRAGMSESQVTGCSSSYARKYALNGLFCIDDGKDSDSFDNRRRKPTPSASSAEDNIEILREVCSELKSAEPEDELLKFYNYYSKVVGNWRSCTAAVLMDKWRKWKERI